MRIPKRPPRFEELLKHGLKNQERLFKALTMTNSALLGPKYVHWDKLRHLTPPDELTHDEWWLAIKLQRQRLYKPVPLYDKAGIPFQYLETDTILEHLHNIDLWAGGLLQMPKEIVTPEVRDKYLVSSLIEEAITSSQIEGASTTRKVAKEMILRGRPPRDRGEQMIMNNYKAMRRIGELRDKPLTKELVLDVHQLVAERALDDPSAAGRLRKPGEAVQVSDMDGQVFHEPPAAEELEERMNLMCDFANGKTPQKFVHPVIRSIVLHFWLAYDHPFVDGNGRTARALFYWSMLRNKFWFFEFTSISQIIRKNYAQYGRAFLYTETDDNDLTYFIEFHLNVISRAIEALKNYVDRKTKEARRIESRLQHTVDLNRRQRDLVGHAFRHPQHRYTIEEHRVTHNITYQTARTDLLDLAERGLLDKRKVGKRWYFTPAADLEDNLTK